MLVILGNQLFPVQHLPPAEATRVFMAEDVGLCTYEKHHQQKIVLFLAAMRAYADELRASGYQVHYEELDATDSRPFETKLAAAMNGLGDNSLQHFEIEDKAMEARLVQSSGANGFDRKELASPMFTCTRAEFASFIVDGRRPRMANFYKWRRRQLGVLVDENGEPAGERWSFDTDNRRRLPKDLVPPSVTWPHPDRHVADVIAVVEREFADHPGCAREFHWPTTRKQALEWLDEFIEHRLVEFGPYEDAMTSRSDTVFHSLLSPYLNLGLITPAEVLEKLLQVGANVPLQSLEGFVRQLIGWREFVRGIYRHFSETQDEGNFWSHDRELTSSWYEGTTGLPPLDDAIHTARNMGWAHHIQRLMVLGNLMTLCEIRPQAAHRWFMEMFVDSSEWVMGPNVFGMGLFSDGGIFSTKPYICGSNYLLKMSDYSKGPWCDTVDGLYWRFINKHREFFAGNPRLALMPRALDRLDDSRKRRIFTAAEQFITQHTQ
jgi:deoxyribodipyrimidine photolyase-related protein